MKLQELLKRHKAISEYLHLTGGRVSATLTHQYLPLLYSGNSLDIVMQNIIIALLGNLMQHIGSLSLIKTISISLPALKLIVSLPQIKAMKPVQKVALQAKESVAAMQYQASRFLVKLHKDGGKMVASGTFRFRIPMDQLACRSDHHPPAASA